MNRNDSNSNTINTATPIGSEFLNKSIYEYNI
jgi:hypothetical protein